MVDRINNGSVTMLLFSLFIQLNFMILLWICGCGETINTKCTPDLISTYVVHAPKQCRRTLSAGPRPVAPPKVIIIKYFTETGVNEVFRLRCFPDFYCCSITIGVGTGGAMGAMAPSLFGQFSQNRSLLS